MYNIIKQSLYVSLFLCSLLTLSMQVVLAEDSGVFSVKQYNAVGDGQTLDTKAIQSAIDAASAAGGGTVDFPAGTYLSGTLILKSNITLNLQPGAVLLGSRKVEDYPHTIPSIRSYTDNYVKQSLIYAENLHNIAITGSGTINGQGDAFKWKKYENRPYIIRMISCEKVLIDGITLIKSPMWMQHYLACEDLTVRNVHVFNHGNYNNDGIDLDSCRNVRLSGCSFDSDDDALCLKSTTDKPCESITITNCVLSSHCNAFKMGTESNGGFKDITFSNSTIHSPRLSQVEYGKQRGLAGIALEIVDGGTMDQIAISNIVLRGVSVPLFLRLGDRARPFIKDAPKPKVGQFKNVSISNIVATGVSKIGCSITGQPEKFLENVSLQDIHIEYEGGGTEEDAMREVEHKPTSYPESTMFGVLPSYGFYCRYVNGLNLRNINLRWKDKDLRSAMICQKVNDLTIDGFYSKATPDGNSSIILDDVSGALLRGCQTKEAINVFLQLENETKDISLLSSDLRKAENAVKFMNQEIRKTFFQTANLGV